MVSICHRRRENTHDKERNTGENEHRQVKNMANILIGLDEFLMIAHFTFDQYIWSQWQQQQIEGSICADHSSISIIPALVWKLLAQYVIIKTNHDGLEFAVSR